MENINLIYDNNNIMLHNW